MCKYKPKGPFYTRKRKRLNEVDLEFLPGQNILREFIEEELGKKPASRMYFCGECEGELWEYYHEKMR